MSLCVAKHSVTRAKLPVRIGPTKMCFSVGQNLSKPFDMIDIRELLECDVVRCDCCDGEDPKQRLHEETPTAKQSQRYRYGDRVGHGIGRSSCLRCLRRGGHRHGDRGSSPQGAETLDLSPQRLDIECRTAATGCARRDKRE